jgi:hypothetical protein
MTAGGTLRAMRLLLHACALGAIWCVLFTGWASRKDIDTSGRAWHDSEWILLMPFVYPVFVGLAALVLLPVAIRVSAPLRSLYIGAAISAVCVALAAPYGSLWGIVYIRDTVLNIPLGLLWFAAPLPALGSIVFYWVRCAMGTSQ